MTASALSSLTIIVVLGIAAQWAAWRLRLPSILLLLGFGLLAGPAFGLLDPDPLFGSLLSPFVSLSVAIILFEGGLNLRFRELRDIGRVFFNLATLGVAVTGLVSAAGAHYLLDFDWPLAAVQGALLVVTGPTVIGPLLRHLRLGGRVGSLLRWEGIAIDPIGAVLAVLVFEATLADEFRRATAGAAFGFLRVILVGGILGILVGFVLVILLRRYWIPDALQNPVTLMAVVGVFTAANLIQKEAGLLAVTVLGLVLANQRAVTVKHIMTFKENLSVLLLSSLFIILAARLRPADWAGLGLRSLLFLAALVVVARPAAVLLAALGSPLTWRERLFLSCMAPRGIVAASVASVFALEMAEAGYRQAEHLVPVTFLVIIGTVLLYGLIAAPLARRLGLIPSSPQGVLFLGAHPWARALAAALQAEGCPVLLADSNRANVAAARLEGLPTYFGSVLSEHALDDLDLSGLGRLVAMTANDEVNALACLRFAEFFGRREVYQLPFQSGSEGRREAVAADQRGRFLFGPEMTFGRLVERFGEQPVAKVTHLTKEFDWAAFGAVHEGKVAPVFVIQGTGAVEVFAPEEALAALAGDRVISLAEAGPAPATQGP